MAMTEIIFSMILRPQYFSVVSSKDGSLNSFLSEVDHQCFYRKFRARFTQRQEGHLYICSSAVKFEQLSWSSAEIILVATFRCSFSDKLWCWSQRGRAVIQRRSALRIHTCKSNQSGICLSLVNDTDMVSRNSSWGARMLGVNLWVGRNTRTIKFSTFEVLLHFFLK